MKQLLALLLFCCTGFWCPAQPPAKVYIKKADRYQPGKQNVLVSPRGREVSITLLPKEEQWMEGAALADIDTLMSKALRRNVNPSLTQEQKDKIKANQCRNARFAGLSRSKVKTCLASGSSSSYNSLDQFVKTLPLDRDMHPVIRALSKPYEQRAIQENKMVSLKNVYLYAYAREEDNDYHLILTNKDKTLFFNAEISGLPHSRSASYLALQKVRTAFERFPGGLPCGNYILPATPLPITRLRGALFFDTDHPAGQVGPAGARPSTAWEIHPITLIEFD